MIRALVFDADAVNRISRGAQIEFVDGDMRVNLDGLTRIEHHDIAYYLDDNASRNSRLLVVLAGSDGPLTVTPTSGRLECFSRILRAGLSQFSPGLVQLPLKWKIYHQGSLLSFQSNRLTAGITTRIYLDVAPEGTNHVFAYHLSDEKEPLTREAYDAGLFEDAYFGFEEALKSRTGVQAARTVIGHPTYAFTEIFDAADITHGLSFSTWRDSRLTAQQRQFFDAPFDGPLRVKGPAGTGKTLVLTMRFLKEVYDRLDRGEKIRACFLTHGEETVENIKRYLMQIDERNLFYEVTQPAGIELEIKTIHALANQYINSDNENVDPLSLDGAEGRTFQLEIIDSVVSAFLGTEWPLIYRDGCRDEFISAIEAPHDEPAFRSFCYDLSDEFASVLETFGVRGIDEIGARYLKVSPSPRALAHNMAEKLVVIELYRCFRQELLDLGVVSLDQFTADFLAYLNSFRWDNLRRDKGFDVIFADELHLFNAQERRVLGSLSRDPEPPLKVAVAYDPRQSPRNSFFPQAVTERDSVWLESGLETGARAFELTNVFRYTPAILAFLDRLNQHFPANDLAEEWALRFGASSIGDGPLPKAGEFATLSQMLEAVDDRIRQFSRKAASGDQVAVLSLDPNRFKDYITASRFSKFAIISSRDDLGLVTRFRRRPILSMPEYVAGLQFESVLLVDATMNLVAELGGGINGLHRFISGVYLGASRAKRDLEIFADKGAGGFAKPIKDAIEKGLLERAT
jgi:hypothetical protein